MQNIIFFAVISECSFFISFSATFHVVCVSETFNFLWCESVFPHIETHLTDILNYSLLLCLFCSMSGPNNSSEWSIEGRRLVPLMPRLVPQTAFTATANAVASATANQNASLLLPAETGNKEGKVLKSICFMSLFKGKVYLFFITFLSLINFLVFED